MRYIPLESADPGWEPTIRESEVLVDGLRAVLPHVYLFNSPGTDQLSTHCPECQQVQLRRDFYGPMGARLMVAGNPQCSHGLEALDLRGRPEKGDFREADFQGGYPFTRALEIVQAMLITLGVRNPAEVVRVWEILLGGQKMRELHHAIQQPVSYLDTMRTFGELTGRQAQAAGFIEYVQDRLTTVTLGLQGVMPRPRVYYAMGKPLFAINGPRFENSLVELAGGHSVNRELELAGRPGMTITVDTLQSLNPEVILLSSFLSNRVTDFHAECLRLGLKVDAVRQQRIYTPPVPSSDFGGPRWILGLLFLANTLHPERFNFDLAQEAEGFFKQFYGIAYNPDQLKPFFWQAQSELELVCLK